MKDINLFLLVFSFLFTLSCQDEEVAVSKTGSVVKEPVTVADTATTNPDTPDPNPDFDPVEGSSEEGVSYLALGDSYTIGQGVSKEERYPVILATELEQAGIKISSTEIIATTGWTTSDLQRGIASAGIEGNEYGLVSLLIGVNNQYQGKNPEEYRKEFRELLLQAIDFAGGNKEKVFVISIPDYGFTPFGRSNQGQISPETDKFNAINKGITTSLGVLYFDITPISRNGLSDPSLVAGDGLHPSGKMYRQWVDLILEEVVMMLKAP